VYSFHWVAWVRASGVQMYLDEENVPLLAKKLLSPIAATMITGFAARTIRTKSGLSALRCQLMMVIATHIMANGGIIRFAKASAARWAEAGV